MSQKHTDDAPPRFRYPATLSLQSWLDREIDPPDYLLGHMISTTTRAQIAAGTGVGKTMFCLALAFSVADGRDFLHWTCTRRARVLYIDGEMGRQQMKARLEDACNRLGTDPESINVLSREDAEDMAPLNTPAGQAYIDGLIEHLGGLDLVIFDNVMSLISGDMKDEEAWGDVITWARTLTRRQIGQIWVHHTGHDTQRAYGTSTREWQLDLSILLEEVGGTDADLAMKLSFKKARERSPANRADFETVIVKLEDNAWSIDGVAALTASPKALKGKPRLALSNLTQLVIDTGQRGPVSEHIPAAARGVTKAEWKAHLIKAGIINGGGNHRQEIGRIIVTLKDGGFIGCWEDFIWPVTKRHNPVT